jgi:hypothetical protein
MLSSVVIELIVHELEIVVFVVAGGGIIVGDLRILLLDGVIAGGIVVSWIVDYLGWICREWPGNRRDNTALLAGRWSGTPVGRFCMPLHKRSFRGLGNPDGNRRASGGHELWSTLSIGTHGSSSSFGRIRHGQATLDVVSHRRMSPAESQRAGDDTRGTNLHHRLRAKRHHQLFEEPRRRQCGEPRPQRRAGAMDRLPRGAFAQPQHAGDLSVPAALQLPQHDRLPLAIRKGTKRSEQFAEVFAALPALVHPLDSRRTPVQRIVVPAVLAKRVDCGVACRPVKPWPQLGDVLPLPDGAVGAKKGLLDRILDPRSWQQTAAISQQRAAVPLDYHLECSLVTGARKLEQSLVGQAPQERSNGEANGIEPLPHPEAIGSWRLYLSDRGENGRSS